MIAKQIRLDLKKKGVHACITSNIFNIVCVVFRVFDSYVLSNSFLVKQLSTDYDSNTVCK